MDLAKIAIQTVLSHRLRSALSILGISIGIASVILLTSIGEGTRRYILTQFSQFGTNLMVVAPGRAETVGIPGALGGTTQKLTIDDAIALTRLPGVVELTPVVYGTARVEGAGRGRSVILYGITPNADKVWQWGLRTGEFWPDADPRRAAPYAVIGSKLKQELFKAENALGRFIRAGGTRFRVIGVMEPKGQLLGMDLDDAVWVPLASAMKVLNTDELNEIDVLFSSAGVADMVEVGIRQVLTKRHGREDFTITSQTEMLQVFGNIMNIITGAVGAIAGVSLVVGSIGILTMMWIAVGERTPEIGLVRAVGATRKQVRKMFLIEASALALLGGAIGVAAGLGIAALLRAAIPGLPVHTPFEFVIAALAVSLVTGLVSGVLPAQRAAQLDPVEALHAE